MRFERIIAGVVSAMTYRDIVAECQYLQDALAIERQAHAETQCLLAAERRKTMAKKPKPKPAPKPMPKPGKGKKPMPC